MGSVVCSTHNRNQTENMKPTFLEKLTAAQNNLATIKAEDDKLAAAIDAARRAPQEVWATAWAAGDASLIKLKAAKEAVIKAERALIASRRATALEPAL